MDATVGGVRYREALETTDKREALSLEKDRIAEIKQGKRASTSGKDFARRPFGDAADHFLEERLLHVSPRTYQLDCERLRPLRAHFGEKPLIRIRAEDIAAFQRARLAGEIRFGKLRMSMAVRPRTVNMEVGVLRQLMGRAKVWRAVEEDVKMLPEPKGTVGKVLSREQKLHLFATAASQDRWLVAYCAAVLAASTTCRGVELKNLRWQDVDLFEQRLTVTRSKTDAGLRVIPLIADAVTALARLRERGEALGSSAPDHFVFPACERNVIDPTRPQTSWRTAWRKLVKAAGDSAAENAARAASTIGADEEKARTAARAPFAGFRFHDLRHQSITELAEGGASDATLMSIAGHMSQKMLGHYSHVRMAAKRDALRKLEGGLMAAPSREATPDEVRPN
jgi:integrase